MDASNNRFYRTKDDALAAPGFLVWVPGPKGPVPQKCADRPESTGNDYWRHNVVQVIPLSAEDFAQPLDYLAMKYPAAGVAADTSGKVIIDQAKALS